MIFVEVKNPGYRPIPVSCILLSYILLKSETIIRFLNVQYVILRLHLYSDIHNCIE